VGTPLARQALEATAGGEVEEQCSCAGAGGGVAPQMQWAGRSTDRPPGCDVA